MNKIVLHFLTCSAEEKKKWHRNLYAWFYFSKNKGCLHIFMNAHMCLYTYEKRHERIHQFVNSGYTLALGKGTEDFYLSLNYFICYNQYLQFENLSNT